MEQHSPRDNGKFHTALGGQRRRPGLRSWEFIPYIDWVALDSQPTVIPAQFISI